MTRPFCISVGSDKDGPMCSELLTKPATQVPEPADPAKGFAKTATAA
jgi:hypothetical protein